MHAMLKDRFVSRVGCILVLTNMMSIVSPPGDKYLCINIILQVSDKCPVVGYG